MSDDDNWRQYPNGRKAFDHPSGFVVIVPDDMIPAVPLCCVVCSYVMRTREDETSYLEYGCCDRCTLLWAYPMGQKWKDGWRPSPEQVEQANLQRSTHTVRFDVV